MPDLGSICGVCNCTGFLLIGFFIGVIFGVLINVILDEAKRRRQEKE
jgi:hypothetical protein